MRSTGCRDKALKIAEERIGLAKKALHVLPDSSAKARLIALAESFVSRQF
jgi:geranylgeranyl pyrophosphate synthase